MSGSAGPAGFPPVSRDYPGTDVDLRVQVGRRQHFVELRLAHESRDGDLRHVISGKACARVRCPLQISLVLAGNQSEASLRSRSREQCCCHIPRPCLLDIYVSTHCGLLYLMLPRVTIT